MGIHIPTTHGPHTDRAYYAFRACPRCQHIYEARLSALPDEVCPNCAKAAEAEERALDNLLRRRVAEPVTGSAWKIIYDPLPPEQGGFTPGATFSECDFLATVAAGVLTPGLKASKAGRVYTVDDDGRLRKERGNGTTQ